MGNLNSVKKAFNRIKQDVIITSNHQELAAAKKLVLPGVGNFKLGMENLSKLGLVELLNELVLIKRKPVLGICLGMQLLTSHSEEGECDGLNWIEGKTIKFKFNRNADEPYLHIPHMGWNSLEIQPQGNRLFNDVPNGTSQYFVHSYFVQTTHLSDKLATAVYGVEIDASIGKDNICGTQFHPEKSHQFGLKILENFVEKY